MRLVKSSSSSTRSAPTRRAPVRRRQAPKWRGPVIRLGLAVCVVAGIGGGIGWAVSAQSVRAGHK